MSDVLIWLARFSLFVALGYGWGIIQDEPGRTRWIYLAGWLGYLVYSFARPSDIPLDRIIPIICMTISVGALVHAVQTNRGAP